MVSSPGCISSAHFPFTCAQLWTPRKTVPTQGFPFSTKTDLSPATTTPHQPTNGMVWGDAEWQKLGDLTLCPWGALL